jgi:F0F1-type ATP synthase membrane subunit b/b'
VIKLPPDITFLIQVVSFLIFWALMRVLVFLPAERALARRRERTAGAQSQAEALRTEAAGLVAERRAAIDAARTEGMQQADQIRRRAEAEEHEVLARHHATAQELLERERAATAAQVEAARGPLRAQAQTLAAEIVVKVLGRAA